MPTFIKHVQNLEAIAAVDLGSNALRAIIARKAGDEVVVVKNMRAPLRLGEDVFNTGLISAEKMNRTEEAFITLLHTFMEYNVTQVRAMATSAMRDAQNGSDLAKKILKTTGIDLEIIGGREEAQIVFQAVRSQMNLKNKTAVLMDVGGGSTELIIVKNDVVLGVGSFNVGTVRLLQYKTPQDLELRIKFQITKMKEFIRSHLGKSRPDLFVGTGGNLRRIGKIRKKILRKETSQMATFSEISHMEEAILSMSFVDRIRRLELDKNRADVILPAIMLTQNLMRDLKMEKIYLPKVGLKEGIILSMLEMPPKKFILKD